MESKQPIDWQEKLKEARKRLIGDRVSNQNIHQPDEKSFYDGLDERSARYWQAQLVWGFVNEGRVPNDWIAEDGWIVAMQYIENLKGNEIDKKFVYPLLTYPHWQVVNALALTVKLPQDAMPLIQMHPGIDAYHFQEICRFQGRPSLDPREQ